MEIPGLFSSHEMIAAGRISRFDPRVEAVSQPLLYICQDVSGAV